MEQETASCFTFPAFYGIADIFCVGYFGRKDVTREKFYFPLLGIIECASWHIVSIERYHQSHK